MTRSLGKRVIGLLCAGGIMLTAQAATSSRTYAADLAGMAPQEEVWILLGAMLVRGMSHELVRYCPTCKAVIIGYADHVHDEGRRGNDCCADLEERIAELEATTARRANRRVSLTLSGQVGRYLFTNYDDGAWSSYVNSQRFTRLGQTPEQLIHDVYRVTDSLGAPQYQNFFTTVEYNADNMRRNSNSAWTPSSLIFDPGGGGAGEGDAGN